MMLLGLVLHSGVNYTVSSLGAAWPYDDPSTNTVFDILVFFIHLFRMPVFFVVAGFFAAFLYARDGVAGFARNRGGRLLIPLAVFWTLLFPVITAGFIFANGRAVGAVSWTAFGAALQRPSLMHLWFLWYLVLLYAAAIVLVPLARRLPVNWQERGDRAFASVAGHWWGALVLGAVTALTLIPMTIAGLDTSLSLLPPLRTMVAYGVFFGFGWLLYRRRDVLDSFRAHWVRTLAAGIIVSIGYLVTTVGRPIADPVQAHLTGVALAGLSMWLLIFGIMGMFISGMNQPRALVRYFSDAAYWMYLVHLPLTIWIPGLLAPLDLPAVLKFSVVLTSTALVTIATYHYLVRSTAIGALLSGRKYPRALPGRERAPALDVAPL